MLAIVIDFVRNAPMKVVAMWATAYIINKGLDMTSIDVNRNKREIEIPIITDKVFELTGKTLTICPQTQLTLKSILAMSSASLTNGELFLYDMISANDAMFANYATLLAMQYVARMF